MGKAKKSDGRVEESFKALLEQWDTHSEKDIMAALADHNLRQTTKKTLIRLQAAYYQLFDHHHERIDYFIAIRSRQSPTDRKAWLAGLKPLEVLLAGSKPETDAEEAEEAVERETFEEALAKTEDAVERETFEEALAKTEDAEATVAAE